MGFAMPPVAGQPADSALEQDPEEEPEVPEPPQVAVIPESPRPPSVSE